MTKAKTLFKRETQKIFKIFLNPTFLYLTLLGNLILITAIILVYYFEHGPEAQIKSLSDSVWWGVSTITTVGYGDKLPQTFFGRLVGIGLMYTGTVLFVSFTGLFFSLLIKEEVEDELEPIHKEIKIEEEYQRKLDDDLRNLTKRLKSLEDQLSKKDFHS